MREILARLAEYEDTLLSPDKIVKIRTEAEAGCVKAIARMYAVDINRLRELAGADREGRVVVLPCKAGDMLYEITTRKTISEYCVTAICVTLGGIFIEWEIRKGFAGRSASGITPFAIGKTVFLTREEAEKTLQEMEGKKDG